MNRPPKALILIKILTKKELDRLQEKLTRDKKLRQLVLLDILKSYRSTSFSDGQKKKLFAQLFNEEYTSAKDFLLRNEFRILSESVEKIMVESEMETEVYHNKNMFNYYLLHALQSRNAIDLFKKEYKDAYADALKHSDYYLAHNMTALHLENFTMLTGLTEKDLPYVEKLNDLYLTHISSYYLAAFRNHQINSEYTRSFVFPFSIHERPLVKEVGVNFSEYENHYSLYLYLKAKSFLTPHSNRIPILEKCLHYIKEYLVEGPLYEEEIKFCLSALANTHSLLFEYEMAEVYFEQFFQIDMPLEDPQRLSTLTNFITKLIKLGKIEQAVHLIEENEPLIKVVKKLQERILCLKIACYALAGNSKKLEENLPVNLSDFSRHLKKFFRFYFAILAYQEGRLEDAHRETQNMYNVYRQSKLTFDVLPILKFFNRFFYLQLNFLPNDEKRKQYISRLSDDIKTYADQTLPEYRSYLPFLWLKRELMVRQHIES